jgi:membrane-associated phospholipid phosphatase
MDETILLAVNGLRSPGLDPIVSFVSDWGYYGYLLVLLAVFGASRTRANAVALRDGWLAFFVSLLVSETIVKPLIRRPRPTAVERLNDALHVLGSRPPASSFSCPSGTATACAAGAAWIWLRFGPRAGVPAALVCVFLSATRLYAGLHWPSDLVLGWIIGAGVAIGIDRFTRWIDRLPA